ncbi:hypothetical protein LSH36_506g02024 [Paralvinella palmiformis]|uniref:Uncharacterized protein n=1 Tax=Paralvinella palmiformis TaxID=53620 RepID=A0AAD9J9B8_9ANNE|nr:hypothetical protein LSH36_506g02024 [Paralvinella palmiformis]
MLILTCFYKNDLDWLHMIGYYMGRFSSVYKPEVVFCLTGCCCNVKMPNFVQIFGRLKSVVIGMIHLKALPGIAINTVCIVVSALERQSSPGCTKPIKEIISTACYEADMYQSADVDGILIENMFDIPWQRPEQIGPETVASITAACTAIKKTIRSLPIGVHVLAGGNKEALAIAKAAGLQFIRAEGYVFSHVGDEGLHHSCAAELTRYRCHIGAEDVHIFTDIKKKHCAHAITSDVSIGDTAKAAELFLSDGVVVTGTATGVASDTADLQEVQQAVSIPVLVGSGVTETNLSDYMSAEAMIVGTHFKMAGDIRNTVDKNRVKQFMAKVRELRKEQKQPAEKTTAEYETPYWSSFHVHAEGE